MARSLVQASPFIHVDQERGVLSSMKTGETRQIDGALMELLLACQEPQADSSLRARFGDEAIAALLSEDFLCDAEVAWHFSTSRLEIETSTHCNWRCDFCPVHGDPKPVSSMDPDLFEEIIAKAERYGRFHTAFFQSYNEPTLDRQFDDRVRRLARTPMKLQLHTNGSGLTRRRVDLLRDLDVLSVIFFNLPTLDPDEFVRITAYKKLPRIIANIRYAIERGLPVDFSVQGQPDAVARNEAEIRKFFGLERVEARTCTCAHCEATQFATTDRAGAVRNEYFQDIRVTRDHLNGCPSPLAYLYIGVGGNIFLCSEDYYQRSSFASIRSGEIDEILQGDAARQAVAKVFGAADAEADHLCRSCAVMCKQGDTIVSVSKLSRSGQ